MQNTSDGKQSTGENQLKRVQHHLYKLCSQSLYVHCVSIESSPFFIFVITFPTVNHAAFRCRNLVLLLFHPSIYCRSTLSECPAFDWLYVYHLQFSSFVITH